MTCMRKIERTRQFRRDYKRESRGRHAAVLAERFPETVRALAMDADLDARLRDHALSGAWANYRDCHIRPDLVLIYRKPDAERLTLVRLGSHAELKL